jgi:hypothetical protein
MKKLGQVIVMLIFFSCRCLAQISPLSTIWTAKGFLDVCGRADTTVSKEQLETVKNAPPSQMMDKLGEVTAQRTAEVVMCLAYVSGLEQGWKEGHEHGVVAAQFPEGWPKDESKGLASLPVKQLGTAKAAMSIDVPCVPDYIMIGQKRDIVVRYIQEQEKKGNFLIPIALTSHVVWLAFQEAFQCPAQSAKPPDPAK